jgi:hypothetical protein
MLLTKRKQEQGESTKLDKSKWPEEFWVLRKRDRNSYHHCIKQVAEIQRARKFLTPKQLGDELGMGVFAIHRILNKPIVIPIRMKKKGVHPISVKVQKKADRINEQVAARKAREAAGENVGDMYLTDEEDLQDSVDDSLSDPECELAI